MEPAEEAQRKAVLGEAGDRLERDKSPLAKVVAVAEGSFG